MKSTLLLIMSLVIFHDVKLHTSLNRFHLWYKSMQQDSLNYKVYKIDSINNYYIIYVRKGTSVFKIVSEKDIITNCDGIEIGKTYKLDLHSLLFVNGHSVIPANQINEISGWRIDNSTIINFEGDSIRDIYYADNIKGLCLIKKRQ
jgi:hypothetical protein